MKQRQAAAILAEVLGTFVLVMVVLNVSRYGLPFFTAIAAGVTVATFFTVASKVGAGHFNPAVTLGLFSVRRASLLKTLAFIPAQFLGALAAWQLYDYFTGRPLENTTTAGIDWKVVVAEALGTLIFVGIITAVLSQKFSARDGGVTIGAGLFLGSSVAGLAIAAGGVLNPAVAFGTRSFEPVESGLAPIVGAILGAIIVEIFTVRKLSGLKAAAVATPAPTKVEKIETKPVAKAAPAKKPATKKVVAKKSTKKVVAKKK